MLERALTGSPRYYKLLGVLAVFIGLGAAAYVAVLEKGHGLTGISRDVSWGLYIAQFTFMIGVAASAVMVVLPYYLHNVKEFGKIVVFGEFLAVAAVAICPLFVIVDLGKPWRALNMILYPTLNSVLFWSMVVQTGYLLLNILVGWNVLEAERKGTKYPNWVKPLIYISIPWAFGIHTVTAFVYAGLPGHDFFLTAILAARFLASAFCSGPALLILLLLVVKRFTNFDPGAEAIRKLTNVVIYAMFVSVFFIGLEFFTAFYSGIPGMMDPLKYMFVGLEGHRRLVPFTWLFVLLAISSLVLLTVPKFRNNEKYLMLGLACVFFSMWLEKGVGFTITGFVPNMLDHIVEYSPSIPEILIALGVWSIGCLLLTVLWKITISVKEERAS
ncbi:MAG: NrfD/PsrC family molybdoenzyme membrane anchor subunit [Syntrophobacteraceae bacterium]